MIYTYSTETQYLKINGELISVGSTQCYSEYNLTLYTVQMKDDTN